MLTQIAYQAIDMIYHLPSALEKDVNIQFHHKPYRHKVKIDKVDKRKREFGESATRSHAKKMRGQLSRLDSEEDKDNDHEGSQNDLHDQSDNLVERPTKFNIDEFLSTLEEVLVHTKDLFGLEAIDEYSAQLEAARIESMRLVKEEKKQQKAEARTMQMQEGSSSIAPTTT